jgi:hypothetical protein
MFVSMLFVFDRSTDSEFDTQSRQRMMDRKVIIVPAALGVYGTVTKFYSRTTAM